MKELYLIYINKIVLVNVDQKSRDAKVAPAKLQQMFNKI